MPEFESESYHCCYCESLVVEMIDLSKTNSDDDVGDRFFGGVWPA